MAAAIKAAVAAGYNHVDTAKVYGTEPLIGPVLSEMFSAGTTKREDIFITCKVSYNDILSAHRNDERSLLFYATRMANCSFNL